jgi:hypothetical protein
LILVRAWLGGTDAVKEGTWVWSFSGLPLTYQNWNRGEPNANNSSENCLEILARGFYGGWNDITCSYLWASVCEKHL